MPEIYGSPRADTIADLMRQRGSVSARAVQQQGDAAAQQAMASGQAWGNAIQNIGQTVSGTLRDYAQQRENAPLMELRAQQSKQLAAELSAMETAQAQKKIGELAQMVKASGYDPSAAEPVFSAIATLSPEYAEPLKRSLMDPAMLRQVTDTLISQTPGYKAPEGFSLSEGQTRFDASGQPIANVPKPEPVQQPFTLGEGQVRYNPDGTQVASGPPKPEPTVNLQADDVLLDGKRSKAVFNPRTGRYSKNGVDVTDRVEPIPPQPTGGSGPRPLTQTAEAQIIQRLATQWITANKPIKELDRQVQLMDTGMEAVKRGDLAQGAQMVLVTFQKILDPPSVVRESEFMRSAAGQSLMNRVRGAYERLTKGGAGVTAAELQKFATLAREASTAQRTASGIDGVKKRLGLTADRYNIPHELIFDAVEEPPATVPTPAAPPKPEGGSYLSTDPNFGEPITPPRRPGG